MDANAILNSGPSGMADFVDQIIEIVDAEHGSSQYGPNVKLTIRHPAGSDEVTQVTTGAEAIVRKTKQLKDGDLLPVLALVVTYPGQFGRDGYDLQAVGDDPLGVS